MEGGGAVKAEGARRLVLPGAALEEGILLAWMGGGGGGEDTRSVGGGGGGGGREAFEPKGP